MRERRPPRAGGGVGVSVDRVSIFFSGQIATELNVPDEPTADEDGHIVGGTVMRRTEPDGPTAPVSARISHGVSPLTAAAMLRKMAEVIEGDPSILSGRPGHMARRLPGGSVVSKHLTAERVLADAEKLDPDTQQQMIGILRRIAWSIEGEDLIRPTGSGPIDPGFGPASGSDPGDTRDRDAGGPKEDEEPGPGGARRES